MTINQTFVIVIETLVGVAIISAPYWYALFQKWEARQAEKLDEEAKLLNNFFKALASDDHRNLMQSEGSYRYVLSILDIIIRILQQQIPHPQLLLQMSESEDKKCLILKLAYWPEARAIHTDDILKDHEGFGGWVQVPKISYESSAEYRFSYKRPASLSERGGLATIYDYWGGDRQRKLRKFVFKIDRLL